MDKNVVKVCENSWMFECFRKSDGKLIGVGYGFDTEDLAWDACETFEKWYVGG